MKLPPFDLRRALEMGIAFTAECKKLTLLRVNHDRHQLEWSNNVTTDYQGRDIAKFYTDERIYSCEYSNTSFLRIYIYEGSDGEGDVILSEVQIEGAKLVHLIEAQIQYQELTVKQVHNYPTFTIDKD